MAYKCYCHCQIANEFYHQVTPWQYLFIPISQLGLQALGLYYFIMPRLHIYGMYTGLRVSVNQERNRSHTNRIARGSHADF